MRRVESRTMPPFKSGQRVRVDIPDATDPDFNWHGEHGTVVDVLEDDAGKLTGDECDSLLYSVELDNHDLTLELRHQDLRPSIED